MQRRTGSCDLSGWRGLYGALHVRVRMHADPERGAELVRVGARQRGVQAREALRGRQQVAALHGEVAPGRHVPHRGRDAGQQVELVPRGLPRLDARALRGRRRRPRRARRRRHRGGHKVVPEGGRRSRSDTAGRPLRPVAHVAGDAYVYM